VKALQVSNPDKVIYLTQTTLSLDDTAQIVQELRRKFPNLQSPPKDDICYATQNRQNAVKEIAGKVDVLLVIGSQNSSNSQRLREVSAAAGVPAYLVNDETEIKSEWLEHAEVVGVTAGASAPEEIVFRVLNYLRSKGEPDVEGLEDVDEHIHFALPPELARSAHSS
jgi:4-hydroxy-3-methylbut-2-en-1-yl diphosphate reductase